MRIPAHQPYLSEGTNGTVQEVLESRMLSPSVEPVRRFEEEVSTLLDAGHGIAVDSGTAALQLALEALGIGPGDEVIVPDFTFGATGLAVTNVGAEPVLVDIDTETLGLSPAAVEDAIGRDTAAIIVAHLFAHPARMDRITDIAHDAGAVIVEDAAQAFGSTHRERFAGTIGDVGCFSFSWNKTITTGKGGFITTGNTELADAVRRAADYGRDPEDRYRFVEAGHNYRMDSVRASIGRAQIDGFETIRDRKQRIVERYQDRLEDVGHVTPMREAREYVSLTPWMFYIHTPERERITTALERNGIGWQRFYPPLHASPLFPDEGGAESRRVCETGIGLPTYPDLDLEQVDTVCRCIRETE